MTSYSGINLETVAEEAMKDHGFLVDFPSEVLEQVQSLPPVPSPIATARDMRSTLWISIDNDDSKVLDLLTFAEKSGEGKTKVYIAVADVAALVPQNTPIDRYAFHNTTSVYTPTRIFPMLPLKLSTDLTSLNENVDRSAVVVQMDVDDEGHFTLGDIFLALVRNQAQLTYNNVADWLNGKAALSRTVTGLEDQLKLQEAIVQKTQRYRDRQGALSFSPVEIQPVVIGTTIKLEPEIYNKAKAIISNLMIIANVGVTQFLDKQGLPTLRRIVRTPKRWDRIVDLAKHYDVILPPEPDVKALQGFLIRQKNADGAHFSDLSLAIIKLIGKGEYVVGTPGAKKDEGHFDLALTEYAHTTPPNRRYPDLIMQRLLESYFFRKPVPYTSEELTAIAKQCTDKEDNAAKVERRVNKSAAALAVSGLIGKQFTGIVTGASSKGTWVKVKQPPIDGKLVQGFVGVDVGDKITVKLVDIDVGNGFIDFIKV